MDVYKPNDTYIYNVGQYLHGVNMGAWGYFPKDNDSSMDFYCECVRNGVIIAFNCEPRSPGHAWMRVGMLQYVVEEEEHRVPIWVIEQAIVDLTYLLSDDTDVVKWQSQWEDHNALIKCTEETIKAFKKVIKKGKKMVGVSHHGKSNVLVTGWKSFTKK